MKVPQVRITMKLYVFETFCEHFNRRRSLSTFFIRMEIMKSFANFLEYSVDRLNGVGDPIESIKFSVSISVSTHLFRMSKKRFSEQSLESKQVIVKIFAIFSVGQSLN